MFTSLKPWLITNLKCGSPVISFFGGGGDSRYNLHKCLLNAYFSLLCNFISLYLMFNYFHWLIMLIVTINYLLTYLLTNTDRTSAGLRIQYDRGDLFALRPEIQHRSTSLCIELHKVSCLPQAFYRQYRGCRTGTRSRVRRTRRVQIVNINITTGGVTGGDRQATGVISIIAPFSFRR